MIDTIEIKWDLLGARLATLSDEEQSEFFTGFAKELMSFETHYKREMQMTFVNGKMKKEVKKTLEKYLPALWYEE